VSIDRNLGRANPPFSPTADPDTFERLIANHGILARILQSRKCPCAGKTGGYPNMYCKLCKGDGYIYTFQRRMLQTDENSPVLDNSQVVHPYRVPLLEPLKVERVLSPDQGGIINVPIAGFDDRQIYLDGTNKEILPLHYERRRVSYYFDRFNYVKKDTVKVSPINPNLLYVTQTLFDDQYRTGNPMQASGDVTVVKRVFDQTGYEWSVKSFQKQEIELEPGQKVPVQGQVFAEYYYAPAEKVLATDMDSTDENEKWTTNITSGQTRIALQARWEIGQGDLITFLVPEIFKDEVLGHSGAAFDQLMEFDVSRVTADILAEDGQTYVQGEDFIFRPFHRIQWIGSRQPQADQTIAVRYAYRPTYILFMDNPAPNTLDNKQFPKVFMAKWYTRLLQKDLEKAPNTFTEETKERGDQQQWNPQAVQDFFNG